jgi:hypothetical protein
VPQRRFRGRGRLIGRCLLSTVYCLLSACSATQSPRTLGRGNAAAGLSLGGPILRVPGVGALPLPYPVVEGRYGLTDRLDVKAGTQLVIDLIRARPKPLSLDLGVDYLLVPERLPDRSAVAVSAKAMIFLGGGGRSAVAALVLPEAALTFSYRLGERGYFYGGLDAVIGRAGEGIQAEAPGGAGALLIATPFIGGQAPLSTRLSAGLELGWIAPYLDTSDAVVLFPLPGGPGAFSVKLGFSYRLGGGR